MVTSIARVLTRLMMWQHNAFPGLLIISGSALAYCGSKMIGRASGTCPESSLYTQFAGLPYSASAQRLEHCAGVSLPGILGWDVLLILGYTSLLTGIILGGWWRFESPRLVSSAKVVAFLPAMVAIADLLENLLTSLLLFCSGDGCLYSSRQQASLVTTVASIKWLLATLAILAAVISAGTWLSQCRLKFAEDPRNTPSDKAPIGAGPLFLGATPDLVAKRAGENPMHTRNVKDAPWEQQGICISGGGIRATAFGLGALNGLEKNQRTREAGRVTAVSGGAWAAASWALQRARHHSCSDWPNGDTAADEIRKHLIGESSPSADSARSNESDQKIPSPWMLPLHYLLNGRGGILGPLSWALFCLMTSLTLIVAIVYVASWIPGWILTRDFLFPGLAEETTPPPFPGIGHSMRDVNAMNTTHQFWHSTDHQIPLILLNPGIYIALAGLITATLFLWFRRTLRFLRFSAVVIAAGLLIFGYTALAPFILSSLQSNSAIGDNTADIWKNLATLTGIGGVLTLLWRLIGSQVTGFAMQAVQRNLLRLFGLFFALALILVGLGVAGAAALGDDSYQWLHIKAWVGAPKTFLCVVAVVAALYGFLGANSPTLAQLFTRRLSRTFDLVTPSTEWAPCHNHRVAENPSEGPGTWSWLRQLSKPDQPNSPIPELVLCCAQQQSGLARGGLPAESLTVSPSAITVGDWSHAMGPFLETSKNVRKFWILREYPHIEYVSSWLAITGAALSSAMGNKSLGSTNAVIAAFNADLGTWIPNPDINTSKRPRPRMAYIFKEILGWYSVNDRFVFATDGGHWDNLGLVEQFRFGSKIIICFDASGDPPGSFSTLREALELATLELALEPSKPLVFDDLEEDLKPLKTQPESNVLPTSMATRIQFKIGDEPGVIYYAKLQLSQSMPQELRRFGKKDKKYPRYSTANQFLSTEQFNNLYEAGTIAADDVNQMIVYDHKNYRTATRLAHWRL
ncbi:MAG: hypothetical protein WAS54_00605 [Scrofimicrobium sp.]